MSLTRVLQGMGRHSLEEVKERLASDLDVCSALLEESGVYLTGSRPCQADCFLFALLHAVCLALVDAERAAACSSCSA